MSVHGGGAAPPVPPLPLSPSTPPAAGAPATAGAPPAPPGVVVGEPAEASPAPAVAGIVGAPALANAPAVPGVSVTPPLSQELRGRRKISPVMVRPRAGRSLGTSIWIRYHLRAMEANKIRRWKNPVTVRHHSDLMPGFAPLRVRARESQGLRGFLATVGRSSVNSPGTFSMRVTSLSSCTLGPVSLGPITSMTCTPI